MLRPTMNSTHAMNTKHKTNNERAKTIRFKWLFIILIAMPCRKTILQLKDFRATGPETHLLTLTLTLTLALIMADKLTSGSVTIKGFSIKLLANLASEDGRRRVNRDHFDSC